MNQHNEVQPEAWLDPRISDGTAGVVRATRRLKQNAEGPGSSRQASARGVQSPALTRMASTIMDRWPEGMQVASTLSLQAHGIGDRLLTAGTRAGIVIRLRRGAYVRARTWHDSKPSERDLLRIEAHSEGCGVSAVYSHVSAARLHGCSTWDCGPQVHVTTGYTPARSSSGRDTRAHFAELADWETVELTRANARPLRVTALERTVIDCSRLLDFERAVVIADQAIRLGADPTVMGAYLNRMIRGARKVANVLDAADGRSESVGESRMRVLLLQRGIQGAVPQLEVHSAAGMHRGDFGWPGERVILEFDGKAKYFDYRPTDQMLFEERRREKALQEAGWDFVRVEWSQLSRPWEVERRIGLP